MAFFDEIGKRISGAAQNAQKSAEIVRLQRLIGAKQSDFTNLFAEIGKLYYSGHKSGRHAESELNALCAHLNNLNAEIEEMNRKLDDLRQICRCPQCGSTQEAHNRFCAYCGEKLAERIVPSQETVIQDAPAQPDAQTPPSSSAPDLSEFSQSNEGGKNVYIHWPAADEPENQSVTSVQQPDEK